MTQAQQRLERKVILVVVRDEGIINSLAEIAIADAFHAACGWSHADVWVCQNRRPAPPAKHAGMADLADSRRLPAPCCGKLSGRLCEQREQTFVVFRAEAEDVAYLCEGSRLGVEAIELLGARVGKRKREVNFALA